MKGNDIIFFIVLCGYYCYCFCCFSGCFCRPSMLWSREMPFDPFASNPVTQFSTAAVTQELLKRQSQPTHAGNPRWSTSKVASVSSLPIIFSISTNDTSSRSRTSSTSINQQNSHDSRKRDDEKQSDLSATISRDNDERFPFGRMSVAPLITKRSAPIAALSRISFLGNATNDADHRNNIFDRFLMDAHADLVSLIDSTDHHYHYQSTAGNIDGANRSLGDLSETQPIMKPTVAADFSLWRYSPIWTIALCVAYLIVFFLGLVGNLSVLWVIFNLRHSSHHSMFATCNKVFNGLIGNLALADLLVIIFCLPATLISNIFTPYFLGRFVCKAVQYFQGVSVSASVYTLVAISIDRFYGIYYPFNNGLSQVVRRTAILFIWFFSLAIAIPWILFFDIRPVEIAVIDPANIVEPHNQTIYMCQEVWPDDLLPDLYFLVVNFGLQYLVPLTIILVFYMLLMVKIWRRKIPVFHSACQRETSTDTVDQWNARIVEQSKMKVLKMLIVIVSLFALSWLPLYLIFLYFKFGHYDENSLFDNLVVGVTPMAQWLGASNSCVNPILYFFFNHKFRAYLKKAITRSLLCSSSIEISRNNHVYNGPQQQQQQQQQHQQQQQLYSQSFNNNNNGSQHQQQLFKQHSTKSYNNNNNNNNNNNSHIFSFNNDDDDDLINYTANRRCVSAFDFVSPDGGDGINNQNQHQNQNRLQPNGNKLAHESTGNQIAADSDEHRNGEVRASPKLSLSPPQQQQNSKHLVPIHLTAAIATADGCGVNHRVSMKGKQPPKQRKTLTIQAAPSNDAIRNITSSRSYDSCCRTYGENCCDVAAVSAADTAKIISDNGNDSRTKARENRSPPTIVITDVPRNRSISSNASGNDGDATITDNQNQDHHRDRHQHNNNNNNNKNKNKNHHNHHKEHQHQQHHGTKNSSSNQFFSVYYYHHHHHHHQHDNQPHNQHNDHKKICCNGVSNGSVANANSAQKSIQLLSSCGKSSRETSV